MGSSSMKVHPYTRGFWDNHQAHETQPLTFGCKRFRPLAPKVDTNNTTATNNVVHTSSTNLSFDLKSFVRTESGPRKLVSSDHKNDSASHQVETHPGGTRWNPTQEQIGMLEMLYKEGIRTPNAQQIEHITEQLSKYGKIEGKNVFYWFQNHKARERQKLKRNILRLSHNPRTTPAPTSHQPINTSITLTLDTKAEIDELLEMSPYKRKVRNWPYDYSMENLNKNYSDEEDKTLELFPLRPEGLLR